MPWSEKAQVCKQRKPRKFPLWHLINEHFNEFEERYEELFSKGYGFYRPIIPHVVRKFLECGDLHQGFGVSLRSLTCAHSVCGLPSRISPGI